MDQLFKELKLEELEQYAGNGFTAAQCAAFFVQCASGGTIGCGGMWHGRPAACDLYDQYCK
ncbi:sublancin family glycopeptide [Laceyella sacchari]|jgi:hypothetical protein|uniref:sublancin family glycopeptide n=1 Tax=Laceyella sacchari TaxID=37482 RepID=UPI0010480ECC|nr:sublancin family glycopeptide [Laceyella sacchari]